MAITAAKLTSGNNDDDQASYDTASVTLTAGKVAYLSAYSAKGADPDTPTCTGWTQIATASDGYHGRLTLFRRAVTENTTAAQTISFGDTQIFAQWGIVEFTGTDTGGVNGADSVVQSKTGGATTGTALTVTFDAAFGDAVNNATYFVAGSRWTAAQAPELTELFDTGQGLSDEWVLGEDATPLITSGGSNQWAAIGIEIAAPAASGAGVGQRQLINGALVGGSSLLSGGLIV
jgi:hypothetical protein